MPPGPPSSSGSSVPKSDSVASPEARVIVDGLGAHLEPHRPSPGGLLAQDSVCDRSPSQDRVCGGFTYRLGVLPNKSPQRPTVANRAAAIEKSLVTGDLCQLRTAWPAEETLHQNSGRPVLLGEGATAGLYGMPQRGRQADRGGYCAKRHRPDPGKVGPQHRYSAACGVEQLHQPGDGLPTTERIAGASGKQRDADLGLGDGINELLPTVRMT